MRGTRQSFCYNIFGNWYVYENKEWKKTYINEIIVWRNAWRFLDKLSSIFIPYTKWKNQIQRAYNSVLINKKNKGMGGQ